MHAFGENVDEKISVLGNNPVFFLLLLAKKEEDDLEEKKSIKKRIKELKVLDPKIAQNLCKCFFPPLPNLFFSPDRLQSIYTKPYEY